MLVEPPTLHDDEPDEPAEVGSDDWSFDAADVAPATETLGDNLDEDAVAKLERERAEERARIEEAKEEFEEEEDEAGRQRRQNVRVNVKYPITVVVDGHPTTVARSRDLSATGVGFATRLPLAVDTPGSVTIEFPDWQFTKDFTVRFVKPILAGRIVGVQFDALSEDERERVVKEVFAVQRAQLQAQRARQKQMAGD